LPPNFINGADRDPGLLGNHFQADLVVPLFHEQLGRDDHQFLQARLGFGGFRPSLGLGLAWQYMRPRTWEVQVLFGK
jgi:hypothetical protein